MRLINADELMAYIERVLPEWSEDKEVCMDCLMNSPTVDAVPVVHGRWESGRYRSVDQTGETYDDGEALICTNCRCGFKRKIVDWRWDYCPACGARMDGEE